MKLPFLHSQRARRVLTSALDPIVTSATMFLVQGAVLLSSDKTQFATYSLAYSYIVMGQAVLSALFGAPLITLLSGLHDEEARGMVGAAALRMQLAIATLVGAVGCAVALALGLPAPLCVLAAFGMVALSFRDALRSVLMTQLRLSEALRVALWFGGGTALALGALLLIVDRIDALTGLAAFTFGALVTLTRPILRAASHRGTFPRVALRQLMGMVAWSLPGATASWLQNSFYLTLVAVNLSLDAVGEVSAARMIVMPILIVATGLLRLAQVQVSRQLRDGSPKEAITRVARMALACLAVGTLVGSSCWAADRLLSSDWKLPAYPHLIELAGAWVFFAAATTARGLFTSLLQAMSRYRELFVSTLVILPFVLAGVALAPRWLGLVGAVLPMAAGEVALLAILVVRVRRDGQPASQREQ